MGLMRLPGGTSDKEPTCHHGRCKRHGVDPWVGKIPWRRDRLPTPVFLGFPGGSDGKESACNVEDLGLISGLGRSPGRGHGNPLQYSCLENPHGQRSLAVTVHRVTKSQTQLKQLRAYTILDSRDSAVNKMDKTLPSRRLLYGQEWAGDKENRIVH